MSKFSFIIISLYLVTQLSQGYGENIISSYIKSWKKKQDCIPCFKLADIKFFQNLLSLNPACKEGKDFINELNSFVSTKYFVIRMCKQDSEQEYKNVIKKLIETGKKGLNQVFSNECKPLKHIVEEERGKIQDWTKKFYKATKACGDSNHLKQDVQVFMAPYVKT